MKLHNLLFMAIRPEELGFLEFRHRIDSSLFCEVTPRFDVLHLKLVVPGFSPKHYLNNQLFFEGRNRFFHLPFRLCRYVRRQKPEVVIVHGFLYPVQTLLLTYYLPKGTRLMVQHHAEQPFRNPLKLWLQRKAYAKADAYLFSSEALAEPFLAADIIPNNTRILELQESSTLFKPLDKPSARRQLNIPESELIFIWVGRLDANKDPLTVLKAVHAFSAQHARVKLYMFYHEQPLLEEVTAFIREHQMQDTVVLKGEIPHAQLETWYSAGDAFIAGSHYESTGYALCEAMACGCIPVVTNIPAFQRLTLQGSIGHLFEAGQVNDLLDKLNALSTTDLQAERQRVIRHFEAHNSFEAQSRKLLQIIDSLLK